MRISAYHARRARVESPGAAFAIPRLPIDRYGLLLGLALVVLFLIAWQRVSAHPGLLGADIGNYLLTERKVFEGDPTGLGFLRPPLVAIPIWIATALLELETATKALAVLAWLATGIPVYVLMRRLTGRDGVGGLIAAFAAVAYLLSTPFAGMLVWGWITFLALVLVPLVALPLLGDLGRREWGRIVLLATVLMLVAATHQVTTLFVAVWLLLAGGGLVLIEDRRALWLLARAVPVTLLLSIWLVPLYLQVGGGAEGSFLGTGLRGWSELSVGFRFFFRDPHAGFWLALVVLATVEMLRRIAFAGSPEDRRSGVLLGSMLLASLGLFAVDGDLAPRMPYYAALPIWALSASALAGALRLAGRRAWLAMPAGGLAMIGLAVLAGLLTVRFDERLEGSLSFFSFIEPRHVAAADFAESETASDDRFVVYPFSFGWWLEGAAGRDAYEVGRFGNTEQSRQSSVAEQILAGDHVLSNGVLLIGDAFPLDVAGTPQIWLTLPDRGERLPLVLFDDAATQLLAFDGAGVLQPRMLTHFDRELAIVEEPGLLRLEKTFADADLSVTQRTEVARGRYAWSVHYRASDPSRAVSRLSIPLAFAYASEVEIDEAGRLLVRHDLREHSGLRYEALVELRLTGRNAVVSVAAEATPAAPGSGERNVTVAIEPWASEFGVSLDFRVLSLRLLSEVRPRTFALETLVEATLAYTRADELAGADSIDFVALDLQPSPVWLPALPDAIDARLRASPAFELAHEREGIVFFRVQKTPWVVDFASAAEAPGYAEVEGFKDRARWFGPGVSDVTIEELEVLGRSRTVVSGEVAHRPEQWSGFVLKTPSLDWTGSDDFAFQFRWGSLVGLEDLAVGFVDDEDRRWVWRIPAGAALPLRDGWLAWFVSRGEAARQDEGFDWERVAQIYVTALAGPDAEAPPTELEIAFIGVVER